MRLKLRNYAISINNDFWNDYERPKDLQTQNFRDGSNISKETDRTFERKAALGGGRLRFLKNIDLVWNFIHGNLHCFYNEI